MYSLAQFFHSGAWGGMLEPSLDDLGRAPFWIAVSQIAYIDVLLSGDNAVVIAMACRGLRPRQRFWGVAVGTSVAVGLRIIFTGAIAQVMVLPYLKLVGGLALIYIAAELVLPERAGRDDVEPVVHLWRAVRTVVVADVVMSLDNIIAIAAAARGNLLLLAIGLVLSIPLVIGGAALITALLDRFLILLWAGAALLGWIAGQTIATDPAVVGMLTRAVGAKLAGQAQLAAAAAGAVLVLGVGALWRRRRLARSSSAPPGGGPAGP